MNEEERKKRLEESRKCDHSVTHTNKYAGTTYCSKCGRLLNVRIEE